MADLAWSLVVGILVIAILYVLVRPGSAASTAVSEIGKSMVSLVSLATM